MKKALLLIILPVLTIAAISCSKKSGSDNLPEPVITGITTDYGGKAIAGKPVQLNGTNFSSKITDVEVLMGVGLDSKALEVTEATETKIVFIAPTIERNQVKIRVSIKGKESRSVMLEFTEEEKPWDDTPTIVLEGAKTITIREGVEWTTFHGMWEGQIRNINILRTTLNEHNRIGIYYNYSDENLMDLDQKCEYLDALVGTNGPMACCHYVRVDGQTMRIARENDPSEYFVYNCALTIDDNVPAIVKVKDNFDAASLPNKTIGVGGPLLVYEGEIQSYPEEDTAAFLKETHPRTAIGISKDGKTVTQVAIDGRWDRSTADERAIGMQSALLAKFMRGMGCYSAMNMDGGGGTAMWVYGQGNSRNIVNHVSENRWDWNGTKLRATGNTIYIRSDLK